MNISIRYLTTYTYDVDVSDSHNALRACPADGNGQTLRRYEVQVDPFARVVSYQDYWGTRVDCFGIVDKHTRLTVVADAEVETTVPPRPQSEGAWPPAAAMDDWYEYLMPSPHVAWDKRIRKFGLEATAGVGSAVEAAVAVQRAVGEYLSYESGSTEVGTSVESIMEQQSGVCQDYAHVALAVYRSLGLPARYVSGYLYAVDSSSGEQPEDADEIDVSTHAWVEVAIPGHGWWALDPTNQLVVGEQHVKIGHGRDYEDVTPLRGVYHGEGEAGGLAVGVKMSRSGLSTHQIEPQPVYRRSQEQQQQQ